MTSRHTSADPDSCEANPKLHRYPSEDGLRSDAQTPPDEFRVNVESMGLLAGVKNFAKGFIV